jgi:maleamate amidohydrolase
MHRIAASPNATATVPLLAAARQKGIPVVYTRVVYHHSGADGGLFVQKVPALRRMVEGEPLADILPELPPAPDDIILIKQCSTSARNVAMLSGCRM